MSSTGTLLSRALFLCSFVPAWRQAAKSALAQFRAAECEKAGKGGDSIGGHVCRAMTPKSSLQ